MALGMMFGVLAGLPAAALVLVASRRDSEDYGEGDYIDVQPTYSDQVTPYTHLFRRATGMPQLPDRQATIEELRQMLTILESEEVTR